MNKIITLTGCSASGKDTLLNYIVNKYDVYPIISTTTRPMRKGEEEGKTYYFKTVEDFDIRDCIETRSYKTVNGEWLYGITKTEITNKLKIGNLIVILDYNGLNHFREYCRDNNIELISYYIDCSLQERLKRSLLREGQMMDDQCLEICRRAIADYNEVQSCKYDKDIIVLNSEKNKSYKSNAKKIIKKLEE